MERDLTKRCDSAAPENLRNDHAHLEQIEMRVKFWTRKLSKFSTKPAQQRGDGS